MSRIPLRDINGVAVLINGLPTCVFTPTSYSRIITKVVVNNSTTSSVAVYKGSLASIPVEQSLLGSNNVLTASISIPAGQQFFVQWSAVGASVSDATARVSMMRDDNPFDGLGWFQSSSWANEAVQTIVVPNVGGPPDEIFNFLPTPADVTNLIHSTLGNNWTVIEVNLYRSTVSLYWFDAFVIPTSASTFGNLAICRGSIDARGLPVLGAVSEIFSYSGILGGNRLRYGTSILDADIVIGTDATNNTGIAITKSPLSAAPHVDITAGTGAADADVNISTSAGLNSGHGINLGGRTTLDSKINLRDLATNARLIPQVETRTLTTDASGFITTFHDLGATPIAVFVQPIAPIVGTVFGQAVVDSLTSTTFRVRCISNLGNAIASTSVTFAYAAFGNA